MKKALYLWSAIVAILACVYCCLTPYLQSLKPGEVKTWYVNPIIMGIWIIAFAGIPVLVVNGFRALTKNRNSRLAIIIIIINMVIFSVSIGVGVALSAHQLTITGTFPPYYILAEEIFIIIPVLVINLIATLIVRKKENVPEGESFS